MSCLLPAGERVELSFNGPFVGGIRLNTRNMLSEEYLSKGYERAQDRVLRRLRRLSDSEWRTPSRPERSNDLVYDVDTYEGKTLLPPYFLAARSDSVGSLKQLLDENREAELEALGNRLASFSFEPPEVRFHDFGTGVLVIDAALTATSDLDAPQLREIVETASSRLATLVNPLVVRRRREFHEAVPNDELIWRRGVSAGRQAEQQLDDTPVQWLHRLYLLDCSDRESLDGVRNQCRSLVPKSRPEGVTDCAIAEETAVFPSIGSSAAVCVGDQCASAFRALKHVVELQNAYWAGAFTIDSQLFHHISELGRRNKGEAGVGELEAVYDDILEIHEQNTLFRSQLFNHVCHMSPQETLIWNELADAWQLTPLLDSVKEKLDTLRDLSERLIQQMSRQYDKKLNLLVLLFTLLSVATVLMDVIKFLQGEATAVNYVRAILFGVIIVVLVLVAHTSLNWTGARDQIESLVSGNEGR